MTCLSLFFTFDSTHHSGWWKSARVTLPSDQDKAGGTAAEDMPMKAMVLRQKNEPFVLENRPDLEKAMTAFLKENDF